MSELTHHVAPIRPIDGLRHRSRPELGHRIDNSDTVVSSARFTEELEDEIDHAVRDELTVLVMRVEHAAIPTTPGTPRVPAASGDDQHVPNELVARIRAANEHIRLVVLSSTEMALFAPSLRRRSDGEDLVAQVLEVLSPPLTVDDLPHHLAPRIGAVMLDHENPSVELLMDGSRLALTECDPMQRAMLFHPFQRVRQQRQVEVKHELRSAVLAGRISAALQPAFELSTGRLAAFEAFARWDRSPSTPVPAIEFVAMADEIGVGHLLCQQVLETSLAVLTQDVLGPHDVCEPGSLEPDEPSLPDELALDRPTLWLIVSPDEVLHPEFGPMVSATVDANPAVRIGLELSPSPPSGARAIHEVLRNLVASGVRVAIGDFGLGNANLTLLQELPIDAVKLDRALIRRIGCEGSTTKLVKALVALAAALDLETTAQGIENGTQAMVLTDLGCDIGQGYFYAEPTSDGCSLRDLLRDRSSD